MGSRQHHPYSAILSRRDFVRWCSAPLAGGLAPRLCAGLLPAFPDQATPVCSGVGEAEYRLTPHYRAQSGLDSVIRNVEPGHDSFISELYAEEVAAVLAGWSAALCQSPRDLGPLIRSLHLGLTGTSILPEDEAPVGSQSSLRVWRGSFDANARFQREAFLTTLTSFFPPAWQLRTAEFEVAGIAVKQESPLIFETPIRYDMVGTKFKGDIEERMGFWDLEWERDATGKLAVRSWRPVEETHSRAATRIFEDITAWALGANASYRQQMLRGTDYWRTVLDVACGIDVYGNNGVACGDIDNDGLDEIYVCQPAGLPNRLYHNIGNGRFEDITEAVGLWVLDDTSCAVFADIDNDGNQDLIVVRSSGPLLFRNQGKGQFRLQPDAFRFAQPPQGTFTGTALGDYDRDGWLDVYFCLYNYYEGIDQYRYPVPYFDARNGPPNFLLRNNRDGTFSDVTSVTGLNQNNDRFSFDCAWCDYNQDGWPDLYVVNDFGRKNLYHNNGDGTFTDVAEKVGVLDIGPGMSSCWFDYDHDGQLDLYVCDMWEPAGTRVSTQEAFMKGAPESIRALFRRHAKGNALFHNQGNGNFEERSAAAGVEKAGWSWSCDAWDFDQDGHSDLYIANGMISGPNRRDLQSFFWRQVVSQSPPQAYSSRPYEEGWDAINELVRSDGTWNGYQRNVFFRNNGDGTFSHVSGVTGLDFADDSRAFALADLDHDGSLEIVLKNRTGPQLRILRNVMEGRGESICLRLRGQKSNRDAIGAIVDIESPQGKQRQFLQAGSGFFSQHTKELFFGLGQFKGTVKATVHWPSGLVQNFEGLPANHRIQLTEGITEFQAERFAPVLSIPANERVQQKSEPLPTCCETWLIDPVPVPDFRLRDLQGQSHSLSDFRGRNVLLNFWDPKNIISQQELERFQGHYASWRAEGLELLAVNTDPPSDSETVRDFARKKGLTFPVLLGSEDMLGACSLLYRYLFDRRRNLGIPTSFLIAVNGMLVKVYQGPLDPARVEADLSRMPQNQKERESLALPFPGKFYGGEFHRNLFTYGVAFFRAGYLDESISWFREVVRKYPDYAAAYYNLGTLYLSKGMLPLAEEPLRQATELRPDDPSAWNNLGMVAAQEGHREEAAKHFQEAVRLNPQHVIALENLGKVYQDLGRFEDAQKSLERALSLDPGSPDVNYDLGMLFAHQDETEQARFYLLKAVELRPTHVDALNNLGVLYIRTGRLPEAQAALERCIQVAPDFEVAYLNLAKVFRAMGNVEKAQATLRQLLAIHPGLPTALAALKELTP